jgi:predicted outer membrane repeat protein
LVIDCEFKNLVAPSAAPHSNRGGALCIVASTSSLFINISTFENNSASNTGGAIHFAGLNFISVENSYLSNKATDDTTYMILITSDSCVKNDQITRSCGPSGMDDSVNLLFTSTGSVILDNNNVSFCVMSLRSGALSSYEFYTGTKAKLSRISVINNSCFR